MIDDEHLSLKKAMRFIEAEGYKIKDSIERMPMGGGRTRSVFIIDRGHEGRGEVARFENIARKKRFGGELRDSHFNSIITLEREASLCNLVSEEAGLPAPNIRGIHRPRNGPPFLMVEYMKGKLWKTFIEESGYSFKKFLHSMYLLGRDIAKVQKIGFGNYGDVMGERAIKSRDRVWVDNPKKYFVDRLKGILDLKLNTAAKPHPEKGSPAFNDNELDKLKTYFDKSLEEIANMPEPTFYGPVLVLTNLHPMHFLVDENGEPSGYFGLQFCQSGPPVLEFYNFNSQLFAYFYDNKDSYYAARKEFFNGFFEAGGQYDLNHETNIAMEQLLSLISPLTGANNYYGRDNDPLRSTWSLEFKELLFDAINGKLDDQADLYLRTQKILKSKTDQPSKPIR